MARYLLLLCLLTALPALALEARWGEHGELNELRQGNTLLLHGAQLAIAAPGWTSQATQAQATAKRDGDTWTGTLRAGTIAADYTQTVRTQGDQLRIDFELRPLQAFDAAAVLWHGTVPVGTPGECFAVTDEAVQRTPWPATLPAKYVLAGGDAPSRFGWVSPTGGLSISGGEGGFARFQIQDDRQWQMNEFEFQAYAGAEHLEPGKPLHLTVILAPLDSAGLAGMEQRTAAAQPSFSGRGPLAIRGVVPSATEVPRWQRLELKVDLSATYQNPFDPEELDLSADVVGPGGQRYTVPGFLYRPYERDRRGNAERLTPAGQPDWRIRFAPPAVGDYTVTVHAKDRTGQVSAPPLRFRCVAGEGHGYVRVSRDDAHYFACDDGTPYFAVGANVCWPHGLGTYDYDAWLPEYAKVGGNYARLWIGPMDAFALERVRSGSRPDSGIGRYDQADCWRLDYVVDLAARLGLRLMFCIDSFNSLRSRPDYPFWSGNPYNAANGGPLAKPEAFFTDATAQRLFRNRLRYLVARWGWSTNVLSWEFWNEVDIIDRYVSPEVRDWHQAMSRYLRGIDPWKHLQTTSFAGSKGDPAVDTLPEMDYTQTHCYGPRDMAGALAGWSSLKHAYGKPHYVGEFGLSAGGAGGEVDPNGVSFHNGLWATLASGDAGSGMLWWWDSFIHPRNLYFHLGAVAGFVRGIDFPKAGLKPVAAEMTTAFVHPPAVPVREDLVLSGPVSSWEASPANQPRTFVVPRTGQVAGVDQLAKVLHGVKNHPALHNPPTFQVDYAQPGPFVVVVTGVSGWGGAGLKVSVDGRTALAKDFPDPGSEKHDTLTKYNGKYAVDVPAGRHAITVENTGADWLYVEYVLPRYVETRGPRLRALGLSGPRLALAWVQHRDHTWSALADGVKPEPITGALLRLPAAPGRWHVTVWDTYRGQALKECDAESQGTLEVALPDVADDVAVKAERR